MKKVLTILLVLLSLAGFSQSSLTNNAVINLKDARNSSIYKWIWLANTDSIAKVDSSGVQFIRPARFKAWTTVTRPLAPLPGMVGSNIDSGYAIEYYNGSVWQPIGSGGGGGGSDASAFHKTGDAFGATSSLGLTDANILNIITNNTARIVLPATTGTINIPVDKLSIGTSGTDGQFELNRSSGGTAILRISVSGSSAIFNSLGGTNQFQYAGTTVFSTGQYGANIGDATATGSYRLRVATGSSSIGQLLIPTQSTKLTSALDGEMRHVNDSLQFTIGGSQRKVALLDSGTVAVGTLLVGNGRDFKQLPKGTANQQIRVNAAGTDLEYFSPTSTITQGTYTPTVSNTTNVTSSTPITTKWQRAGNEVTVYGNIGITATAPGAVTFSITLPTASDLTSNGYDLSGICSGSSHGGIVYADATNDVAVFSYNTTVTSAEGIYFRFTYIVQ